MKKTKQKLLLCLSILSLLLTSCAKDTPSPSSQASQTPAVSLRVEQGMTPQTIYNALVGQLGLIGSVLEHEGTGPLFQEAQMYTVRSQDGTTPFLLMFSFIDCLHAQQALQTYQETSSISQENQPAKIYQKDNLLILCTNSNNDMIAFLENLLDTVDF